MPQYVDCYFLIDQREREIVNGFLNDIFPLRSVTTDDFVVANGTVIQDVSVLMKYLESNLSEEQSIYWENKNESSPYKHAMVFYTDDGKMIFGVTLIGKSPEKEQVIKDFLKIKSYLGTQVACMTVEEAPPYNSVEFIDFCKERYVPNS